VADFGKERRARLWNDRLDEIRAAACARPRHEIVASRCEVVVVVDLGHAALRMMERNMRAAIVGTAELIDRMSTA
jgi:hypothetical protein